MYPDAIESGIHDSLAAGWHETMDSRKRSWANTFDTCARHSQAKRSHWKLTRRALLHDQARTHAQACTNNTNPHQAPNRQHELRARNASARPADNNAAKQHDGRSDRPSLPDIKKYMLSETMGARLLCYTKTNAMRHDATMSCIVMSRHVMHCDARSALQCRVVQQCNAMQRNAV